MGPPPKGGPAAFDFRNAKGPAFPQEMVMPENLPPAFPASCQVAVAHLSAKHLPQHNSTKLPRGGCLLTGSLRGLVRVGLQYRRPSGTTGGNLHGQLGDGTRIDRPAFVRMNATWDNTLVPVLIQTGVGYHTVVLVGVCRRPLSHCLGS